MKRYDFRKILESISRRYDTRRTFDAFVRMAACALACQTREQEYLEEAKHWNKEELNHFAHALFALKEEMDDKPFEDVIGCYYMEFALSSKGQQWGGEFHTPRHLCEVIARMAVESRALPAEGRITVAEPACGAGAMILALAAVIPKPDIRRLRVTATDVSRTACDMCYINTTLWGIPTRVVHGNTLSLEVWNKWDNIHWIMPWLPLLIQPKGTAPERDDSVKWDTTPIIQEPETAPPNINLPPLHQFELKL